MVDFQEMLRPAMVIEGVTAANKKAALQSLGAQAAAAMALDAKLVVSRLLEREKVGSTGFGGGIAIPHARMEGLEAPVALFARLAQPVDFQAVDELPVDLIFLLLSPIAGGGEHLRALAGISRRLRDQAFVEKLRGAGSRDALYALWTGDEARDAA